MIQGQALTPENTGDIQPSTGEVATGLQPTAPIAESAARGAEGRTCGKCGAIALDAGDRCQACGAWLPANEAAVTHGARRMALLARPEIRAEMAQERAAVLADLGGEGAVSRIATGLVDSYVATSLLERYVLDNLARHGVLTARGRSRAAVNQLLAILDRKIRLASALGLDRRAPGRAARSPMEALERLPEHGV